MFRAKKLTPFITVIIVAHDRMEYVHLAIDSVLYQKVNSDIYEIIVVSDFEIPISDQRKGIKYIQLDEPGYGSKLLCGLENSNGEIVSLLDDDDLFDSEKLAFVNGEFSSDPDLVYLHNNFNLIDEGGNSIQKKLRKFDLKEGFGEVQFDANRRREIVRLNHKGLDFNHSCISFRSSILNQYKGLISEMSGSLDSAIYFIALSTGMKLKAVEAKLTRYRIHKTSESQRTMNLQKLRQWTSKETRNYTLLYRTLAAKRDNRLSEPIANKIVDVQIVRDMLERTSKKEEITHIFRFVLTSKIVTPYLMNKLIFAVSNLASNKLALLLYRMYSAV